MKGKFFEAFVSQYLIWAIVMVGALSALMIRSGAGKYNLEINSHATAQLKIYMESVEKIARECILKFGVESCRAREIYFDGGYRFIFTILEEDFAGSGVGGFDSAMILDISGEVKNISTTQKIRESKRVIIRSIL